MANATLITDGFGDSSIFSPQFVIQGYGAAASTNALATLITDAFGESNPAFSPWLITEGYRSDGTPTVFAGWRSMMMFWLGGISAENFVPPTPVVTIDTHDGFDGKHHVKKRDAKERLHNQVEEAFRRAFEKPTVPAPVQADAAYFDPLQGFVFPAYRELPKVDDDSDDEDFLLLSL